VFAGIISSQPGFAPAFNNLAFILYQQGRYQEALTHSRTAMDLGGEFNAQYNDTHTQITAALATQGNRQ
jgi:hypothetical protein